MKLIKVMYQAKTLFLILVFISTSIFPQKESELKNGLIGLYYSDADLSNPRSIWELRGLNSEEMEWRSSNDFSGKWIGYVKASKTGEMYFYGEADNSVQVYVEGIKLIDTYGESDKFKGRLQVIKDKLYAISVKYKQLGGISSMKIFWGLSGDKKENIPDSALFYSPADRDKIAREFGKSLQIDTKGLEFDISSIITIQNAKDVVKKRELLINKIWGDTGLPKSKLPNKVEKDITDSDFSSLNNLKQIDRLTIDMDFGLNSIAYHFVPKRSNGELTIYHQGHDGKFNVGIRTINAFLEKGYDVIALSMPVKGMNSKPIVDLKRYGRVIIASHEQFRFLNPEKGLPVKYFLEPITTVINYAEKFDFKRLIMIGLSGGGWTTTQYAALDTRILISFPTAGSLPEYVRMRDINNLSSLYGDYEQSIPQILTIANYLELYIMASNGENRSQMQILNEFDDCCFRGTGANSYKKIIKDRVKLIGPGSYNLFIDATHAKHQISPKALELIFEHLQKN